MPYDRHGPFGTVLVHDAGGDPGADALALARLIAATCDSQLVVPPEPARRPAQLHASAEQLGADLMVVSAAPGNHRMAPQRLLHNAPCAVAVAPAGYRQRDADLRVLGVGYNGSAETEVALEWAIDIALAAEATVRIFVVAPARSDGADLTPEGRLALEARARRTYEVLSAAAATAPDAVRAASSVKIGNPADVLLEQSELGIDLMVIGSAAGGAAHRLVAGSVAEALMIHGDCPLLVSPRGATVGFHGLEPVGNADHSSV